MKKEILRTNKVRVILLSLHLIFFKKQKMTAHILTIGDEILIGQIIDSNSAWMAEQLNLQGIQVTKMISISDTAEAIREALDDSFAKTDLVLMTGGLGPTKDDITKKTLAEYYEVGMSFHEESFERLSRMFARWGRETTHAHREQCYMPDNAEILTNKTGTAPGMWFARAGKIAVSMPGIPYEMKYLMEHEVLPLIAKTFPGKPIAHRTILTIGEGESRIAHRIQDIEEGLPDHIKLAYLPNLGQVRLRLSATGDNLIELEKELNTQVALVETRIPEFVFGYEKDTIENVMGQLLLKNKKTIATAESCTGGLVAHRITSIPGSSTYYEGSVIAYSYALKEKLLNVSSEILETHGAVSEETVKAMLTGLLESLGTDIGIAISGIAGPGGGTPEKPVGTIWVAVGDKNKANTLKLQLGKSRSNNIKYTTTKALDMVRRFLLENA